MKPEINISYSLISIVDRVQIGNIIVAIREAANLEGEGGKALMVCPFFWLP